MNSIKILDVFIGNKCNLSCLHCDTRSDIIKTKTNDPSIESIKQGISLSRKHFHIDNYSLLGGEALFYMDRLEEISKFIREVDQDTNILIPTNGKMIDRTLDKLTDLITRYDLTLVVCDHFSAFEDTTLSDELKKSTHNLINKLGLTKGSSNDFFDQVLYDIPSLNINSFDEEEIYPNDQGRITVFFKSQDEFQANYNTVNGKPKPFMTGDSKGSYSDGCCSTFCTFLRDGKLYKCASLATLPQFLKHHEVYDDPDWQKYLAYQPLDLATCSDKEVTDFSNNKYKESSVCDMCPNDKSYMFRRTPEKVIRLQNV